MKDFWGNEKEEKPVTGSKESVYEMLKYINEKPEAQVEPLPEYILEMIQAGLLYPDGKRTVKNIQDIADFLVRKGMKITGQFLAEIFRTNKGKPYSLNSCNDAVTLAMTQPLKYKPVKNK